MQESVSKSRKFMRNDQPLLENGHEIQPSTFRYEVFHQELLATKNAPEINNRRCKKISRIYLNGAFSRLEIFFFFLAFVPRYQEVCRSSETCFVRYFVYMMQMLKQPASFLHNARDCWFFCSWFDKLIFLLLEIEVMKWGVAESIQERLSAVWIHLATQPSNPQI